MQRGNKQSSINQNMLTHNEYVVRKMRHTKCNYILSLFLLSRIIMFFEEYKVRIDYMYTQRW